MEREKKRAAPRYSESLKPKIGAAPTPPMVRTLSIAMLQWLNILFLTAKPFLHLNHF
jgi:hypothetical protein